MINDQDGIATLQKHVKIGGADRARLAVRLSQAYLSEGASIRDLAKQTGRSYTFVRQLLREQSVRLRARGGYCRWH